MKCENVNTNTIACTHSNRNRSVMHMLFKNFKNKMCINPKAFQILIFLCVENNA